MTKEEILESLRKMRSDVELLKATFPEGSLGWLALEVAWQALRLAWNVVHGNSDGGKMMFLLKSLADYKMGQKDFDHGCLKVGKKARKA